MTVSTLASRGTVSEQTFADTEQTLADSDQTLADSDQTSGERDQSSADSDQAASDRDQAASDRDLAHGVDPEIMRPAVRSGGTRRSSAGRPPRAP